MEITRKHKAHMSQNTRRESEQFLWYMSKLQQNRKHHIWQPKNVTQNDKKIENTYTIFDTIGANNK